MSCCRGLWARPDVAASGLLWGSLTVCQEAAAEPAGCASSLAAWGGRRAAGVQQLSLHGWLAGVEAVLRSLAGGPLVALGISANPAAGWEAGPALAQLASCPSLTRLELCACRLQQVPAALAALSTLCCLALNLNDFSSGESAFQGLSLSAPAGLQRLSRLELEGCGLRKLPRALSTLGRLEELSVACNASLGAWSKGNLHALQLLPELRRLDASHCGEGGRQEGKKGAREGLASGAFLPATV